MVKVSGLVLGDAFIMIVLVGLTILVFLDMLAASASIDAFMTNFLIVRGGVVVHLMTFSKFSFAIFAKDSRSFCLVSFFDWTTIRTEFLA